MSKSRKELESLTEALDDVPIDEEEAREAVAQLGIDVKSLAEQLRKRVAGADEADAAKAAKAAERADRRQKIEAARAAYAAEVERLERRKAEPKRSRDEQLVVFRALLAKAPPQGVAMHFLKYESASDDELAELIRSLRELLGDDESE